MTDVPASPLGEQVTPGTADQHLLDYISSNSLKRIFLVTGHRSFSFLEERGFLDKASAIAEIVRWSDTRPNPRFSDLKKGLEAASALNPDVIIGIGGGSILDMAKLFAVMQGKTSAEVDAITTGAVDLTSREVRLLLIPTTAGSGAEATHFSVLYREAVKYSIAGEGLLPDHIVLDPFLVTTGDSKQRAASGLDALCQCIESIWARAATAQSREIAVKGLEAVAGSLVEFVSGDNSLAGEIQWGSHMGGHAINTSRTTAPHALSYFLTMNQGVPHGIAVASTIGYFLDHHSENTSLSDSSNGKLVASLGTIKSHIGLAADQSAIEYFSSLFDELGLGKPTDYWPQGLDAINQWLSSANPERLGNHPVHLSKDDLIQVLKLD